MEKKVKILLILFLVLGIVGLCGFTVSFVMYLKSEPKAMENTDKDDLSKQEEKNIATGDIIFDSIDDSIVLEKAVPTLDKFGVLNKPFTFKIKNNGRENIKYTLKLN